jgi:hypothetical protein
MCFIGSVPSPSRVVGAGRALCVSGEPCLGIPTGSAGQRDPAHQTT